MTAKHVLTIAAERMTPEQREHAQRCQDHWVRQWRRIRRGQPLNVAATLHGAVDTRMADMLATAPRAGEVSCRKGCAHCCLLNVDVTPQEAKLAVAYANERGFKIDTTRLARQAAKTQDTWAELEPQDRRCVFLGADDTCQVYEHRPSACRKYLVVGDPDRCDSIKYPGGEVGILFDLEAEIMVNAASTVFTLGGLARMVSRALGIKEKR